MFTAATSDWYQQISVSVQGQRNGDKIGISFVLSHKQSKPEKRGKSFRLQRVGFTPENYLLNDIRHEKISWNSNTLNTLYEWLFQFSFPASLMWGPAAFFVPYVAEGVICLFLKTVFWHLNTKLLVRVILGLIAIEKQSWLPIDSAWRRSKKKEKKEKRKHDLIFTIYLIRFFLTKQFPHKPEHTKCIKKTVQSVVVMSETCPKHEQCYLQQWFAINVYHTKAVQLLQAPPPPPSPR